MKKYIFLIIFFIFGAFSISTIKNATRDIEKEIKNVNEKIGDLNSEIYESKLDYNFLSSPENILTLYENNFDQELTFYNAKQFLYIDLNNLKKNISHKVKITSKWNFLKKNVKK